jgi:hypothetical protein
MIEAVCSYETSVKFVPHFPEDDILRSHRCEDLKSDEILLFYLKPCNILREVGSCLMLKQRRSLSGNGMPIYILTSLFLCE